MLELFLFTDFDQNLKKSWQSLQDNSNSNSHPFNTYNWNKNWFDCFKTNTSEIYIFLINFDNTPVFILPLIKKSFIFNYLENFGSITSDYCPILLDKSFNEIPKCFKLINIKLNSLKISFLFLDKIRSTEYEFIKSNYYKKNFINTQINTYSYTYDSFKSDNFLKRQNKNNLDINRQIKRLNNLGKLQIEIINNHDNENLIIQMINLMIKLKANRYIKTNKRNIFADKRFIKFYQKQFNNNKVLKTHISILKLDEKIISIHIGIIHNNSFYYLMPAYDEQFSKFSPGKILLSYLLKWTEENEIYLFDFTTGNENYKTIWANNVNSIFIFNKIFSLKGLAIKFLLKIKDNLRNIRFVYFIFAKIKNM